MAPLEHHRSAEGGWLRAAVLGGNDGIVSTSALVVAIASADPGPRAVLVGGLAGLVAGALSMGVGEYVSVSSERDAQEADVRMEAEALASEPEAELQELAESFVARGVRDELAWEVARQLTEADALGAHLREELGLDVGELASPVRAALASTLAFSVGALPPVLVAAFVPADGVVAATGGVTVLLLAVLGALSARQSGAPLGKSVARVVLGGLLAMGLSAGIGALIGHVA
jgi:VIT1/CCC1 family predicted Fe2+/Mn2+ transporter